MVKVGIPISYHARSVEKSTVPFSRVCGVAGMLLLWSAVTLAAVQLAGANSRSLLITANAAILLGPLAFKILVGRFDIFEPLVMADFSMAAMFVGRPLSDILTGHYNEHRYDISASYDETLFVVLCANIAFQLGYFCALGPWIASKLRRAPTELRTSTATIWAVTLSVLGLLLFGFFLGAHGGVSFLITLVSGRTAGSSDTNEFTKTSAYLYNSVQLLVPGSTMLFAVWLRQRRFIFLAASITVLSPYMLLQVGSGARSGVIGLLFGLPLMWYVHRRKRPSIPLLLIGGAVFAFFLSFLREYRNVETRSQNQLSQYTQNPVDTVLQLFTSDDDEMFDVIGQEVSVTPWWVPFRPFGVIRDIFVRGVPRNLWPDKPKEMDEELFATLEPARYAASHAGTATSLIGYYYLEAGLLSVVYWMFLTGVALRVFWSWFVRNINSLSALMIYSTVPAAVLGVWRGSLPWAFAGSFFTTFPIILFAMLQNYRVRWR